MKGLLSIFYKLFSFAGQPLITPEIFPHTLYSFRKADRGQIHNKLLSGNAEAPSCFQFCKNEEKRAILNFLKAVAFNKTFDAAETHGL